MTQLANYQEAMKAWEGVPTELTEDDRMYAYTAIEIIKRTQTMESFGNLSDDEMKQEWWKTELRLDGMNEAIINDPNATCRASGIVTEMCHAIRTKKRGES